jgi:C4-dicarboxylate-specific signal transduction histidine kinase
MKIPAGFNSRGPSAFTDNWTLLVGMRLRIFGGTSVVIFLASLIGWALSDNKTAGGYAVLGTFLFFFPNVLLSRIADGAKSPFLIERIRLLCNSLLVPVIYATVGDARHPFFYPYVIMCLTAPTTTFLFAEAKSVAYIEVAFWVVHFVACSLLLHRFEANFSLLIATLEIAIPGVFLVQLMDFVRQSLMSERAQKQTVMNIQSHLIKTEKLSALGEMAGGIAHEINTPLAIIGMRIQQLQELESEGELTPEMLRDGLSIVNSTVDRMAKIVKGLRNVSRDGSHDPIEEVRLEQVIADAVSLCSEKFKHSGVSLRIGQTPDDAVFLGRGVELSQVLLNLLNNAFDAAQGSPEKWVQISVETDSQGLRIRVSDSGPGIDPRIRDKIFQPFYTTKEVGRGTGLGLSISMGIIRGLGGEILLERSTPHTCFTVSLPQKSSGRSAA